MIAKEIQENARRLSTQFLKDGFQPRGLHEYTDADGIPLFWRIRLKHPQTGDKQIRPMRKNGDSFQMGEPEFKGGKPLYHLHEIATRPDEMIVVCEGENCADALGKIGILATTSGGATSADRADWQALAGRDVLIWPDFDTAGKAYADSVKSKLQALGCDVRVIDAGTLGLDSKGDAVDWLKLHRDSTAADVFALPTIADTTAADGQATEPAVIDDGEIYRRMMLGSNHAAITKLLDGDWQGDYPSQSEADSALLTQFKGHTSDTDQIMRIFRSLPLGQREEAQRGGYLLRSIENAPTPNRPPPVDTSDLDAMPATGATGTDADTWPELCPFGRSDELPPVPQFDPLWLPDTIRDFACSIAGCMNTSLDAAAWWLEGILGSLIGRQISLNVRPPRETAGNWKIAANIWIGVVAPSGDKKTPVWNAATRPLEPIEKQIGEQYARDYSQWRAKEKAREAKEKQLQRSGEASPIEYLAIGEPEPPPHKRKLTLSHGSPERIISILSKQNGLLLTVEEISSWLTTLERPDNAERRRLFVESNNGWSKWENTTHIRGDESAPLTMSIIGAIQPEPLHAHLDAMRGKNADGLLQRFVVVWPDRIPHADIADRSPGPTCYQIEEMTKIMDALANMKDHLPRICGRELYPDEFPILKLTEDAFYLFQAWDRDNAKLKDAVTPEARSYLSKFDKVIGGLALIHHLCEGRTGSIEADTMARVLQRVPYLHAHMRRVYGDKPTQDEQNAQRILEKGIKDGRALRGKFTAAQVVAAGWKGLPKTDAGREAADRALSILQERGYVRKRPSTGKGRPTDVYDVNPTAV